MRFRCHGGALEVEEAVESLEEDVGVRAKRCRNLVDGVATLTRWLGDAKMKKKENNKKL